MHRFLALCALFFGMLMNGCGTAAFATPAQPAPLVVEQGTRWPLSGHLAFWRDSTGLVTIDEVLGERSSNFVPLEDKLSLGFTPDAVWLRFTFDFKRRGDFWLKLGQSVMVDVQFFVPGPDGRYVQVSDEPQEGISARRLEHRLPLFEISPEPGTRTYFVRLKSSTSMSTNLTLWEPRELLKASTREGFIWGWVFGAYMLVVVFYFFFWLWSREPVHLLYTAYVSINCMAALFTGAWPAQFFPDVSTGAWLKWLGIWISLSVFVGAWFSIKFLRLDERWPFFSKNCLFALMAVCLAGALGVLTGHYRQVVPFVQLTSVLSIVMTLFIVLHLIRRGHKEAPLFLFAFSFFYIGVSWRYLRNFGLLEPSFWNDNSYQVGAFVHMLVMSTGIFAGYSRLRREKESAESRGAAEARLREEQRDFVSMVSHELRTPLSIIGAATDNLAQETGLSDKSRQRVQKIIKSTERMTHLMNNYLSKERMLLESSPLQFRSVDVVSLSHKVREELDGPQALMVSVHCARAHLFAHCDAELIQIALRNLVNNALRHSPAGGRVSVLLEPIQGGLDILVRDEGSGIPDDELDHIFTRFYRGRSALDQPGAGLGLYLVRTIAERHGGSVNVRNLLAGGCEFQVHLPQ